MKRRLICAILAVIFVFCSSASALAQPLAGSGSCGDDAEWQLSKDGVLVITGSGAIYDYSADSPAPWSGLAVSRVEVGETISDIGSSAFASCRQLVELSLPLSLESIGESAFADCTALRDVFYAGSLRQWRGIDLAAGNDGFDYAELHCADTSDPFTDIASSHFHDEIVACYMAELVDGCPDGRFLPDDYLTRAQFVTMLYNLAGRPEANTDAVLQFADADDILNCYRRPIAWGVANGIIFGCGDGTMRPDENISRAQMAAFVARLLKLSPRADELTALESVEPDFTDRTSIPDYFKASTAVVSALGIIKGYGDNAFHPNDTATRGQASAVLIRTLTALETLNA